MAARAKELPPADADGAWAALDELYRDDAAARAAIRAARGK